MANNFAAFVVLGFTCYFLYACHEDAAIAPARAAARQAEERNAANSMHITYDDYQRGKEKETDAMVACRVAVMSKAKWGAESDWTPNGTWTIQGNKMFVQAHDVRVKNGFGAAAYVVYRCVYDIEDGGAAILSVKDY